MKRREDLLSASAKKFYNALEKLPERLDDKGKSRTLPFRERKEESICLAESFLRLSVTFKSDQELSTKYRKKFDRVFNCGTDLEYVPVAENGKIVFDEDGKPKLKLHDANFCRVRLCPMCAWRRSRKIYSQFYSVTDKVLEMGNYSFVFLTLTCRNCWETDLSKTIDDLLSAYDKLFHLRKIEKSFIGAFRALEVTKNKKRGDVWCGSYHPHLHVVAVVETDKYFSSPAYYITSDELVKLWKHCLGVDYLPSVDIRKIDEKDMNLTSAVAEVAKYTVKSQDLFDWNLCLMKDSPDQKNKEAMAETDSTVFVLDEALRNRRLVSYRGILKRVFQKLRFDDPIDGDLVNTNSDPDCETLDDMILRYSWDWQIGDYCLITEAFRVDI